MRPYQLVEVDAGSYKFIGQAMSFPTPEKTIMLRRVPGDSTTLCEIAMERLKPLDASQVRFSKYIHYARVSGHGCFPTDMLRREWASPVNFAIIEGVDGEPHSLLQERENLGEGLVIATTGNRKIPMWNVDRWISFGWAIKELHSRLTEEEA